ncbi:MAG: hypothetical protein QMD05_09480 [Candidatus Brocadiaceae bacterium]|nr:hypothetical protein [Candidatus Brocadiaceae bacterium]
MRKDYIYQDKGQFRLLQNATRLGNFMTADYGFVPIEQVLPEQRFAHQPIFRRPPEEMVKVFSYGFRFGGVADKLKKKTSEAGVDLEYTFKGGNGRGFILKNWSAGAQAIPSYPGGPPIGNSLEGASLLSYHWPVFFKDYIWLIEGDAPAVFYSKIKPNGYETKEIKVAFQEPDGYPIYAIYFIYRDTEQDTAGNLKTVYKMVVDKQVSGIPGNKWGTNPPGWHHMVQYKAGGLEGPWVYEKTWNTDLDYIYWETIGGVWYSYTGGLSNNVWDAFIYEFANLILSKSHNQLSLAVGQWSQDSMMMDVLTQVYSPPFTRFGYYSWIESRGREGEIAIVPPKPPGYTYAVKYLVKRLGNGQVQKTFITRLAWPEWFPS